MPSFLYTLIALAVVMFVALKLASFLRLRKMRAAPRITGMELDTFWSALTAASLPMAKIEYADTLPKSAKSSKVGGSPFADPAHSQWPTSPRDGTPMLFLAQINFADLPPMADFPPSGLLQLFVACNTKGHLENTEDEADRCLRWCPDPQGEASLPVPEAFLTLKTRGTLSQPLLQSGRALHFTPSIAKGNPFNWPFDDADPYAKDRLGETPEVQARLDRWDKDFDKIHTSYGTHWVGGHPIFVQGDPRAFDPALQNLTRVLLHLSSDDDICLGDSGELNLMIAQEHLQAHRFEKAICQWDCA